MAHLMPEDLLHPAVEFRTTSLGYRWSDAGKQVATSLDLLEVYPEGKVVIKKGMGHADFAEYCDTNDLMGSGGPLLRVLFVEDLYIPPPLPPASGEIVVPSTNAGDLDETALLMHNHFGVPMLFFFDQVKVMCQHTIGNTTSFRRNKEGKKLSLDGYYQFYSGSPGIKTGYVWFSQSLEPKTRSTNYIVHNAPAVTKEVILHCAQGSHWLSLTRPFAIDAFLINDCILYFNHLTGQPAKILFAMERITYKWDPEFEKDVSAIHRIAMEFNQIIECVCDLSEALDFLLEALKRVPDQINSIQQISEADLDIQAESFALLKSKTAKTIRHISNLQHRVKLEIDLQYTLENQRDSRTNLKIARLTGNIAVSSQNDSSSMITMAAVTMFLPGTFVSALFSMVFFSPSAGGGALGNLSVAPQWWLFPLITIPLTILVFTVWLVWKRRRNIIGSRELEDLKIEDPEKGKSDPTVESLEAVQPLAPRPWTRLQPASLSKMVNSRKVE